MMLSASNSGNGASNTHYRSSAPTTVETAHPMVLLSAGNF
jgi:hypothetical protein